MASVVSVHFSEDQFQRAVAALNGGELRRALFNAIKRTTSKGTKIAQEKIQEKSNISTKYVKRAVTTRLITNDPQPPEGQIRISHQPLPLIAYKPKVTKRGGVVANPWKDGHSMVFRHGFKAKVNYQNAKAPEELHTGVFIRTRHLPSKGSGAGRGKLTPKGFAGRLAIKQLMGPSAYGVAAIPEVEKAINEGLQGDLDKQLQSQIDRFTK